MLYPIEIQGFEDLRNNNYVYVDKTHLIHKLVSTGKYYFLSRPRRFGKSLLVSTMEAYFKGKKHLFEGLAMEDLETEWIEYPVLHLDLNGKEYDSPQALTKNINYYLSLWDKELATDTSSVNYIEIRFKQIIDIACKKTGKKVVILIDDYDKPILQTICNPDLQNTYCEILRAFYSVLKSCDGQVHFGFLTGTTKSGKVLRDLNLCDLSMNTQYYDICGISEEELLGNFEESIKELAHNNGQTYDEACARLRSDYGGYHFSKDAPEIYNPFSILNTFSKNSYGNYWFEPGIPTYLVELLKKSDFPLDKIDGYMTGRHILRGIYPDLPIAILYQSGYLSFKDYDKEFDIVTLGFPNKEVERGFFYYNLSMAHIKTEKEYLATMARINQLFFETNEGTPVDDPRLIELDMLSTLVAEYETEVCSISSVGGKEGREAI